MPLEMLGSPTSAVENKPPEEANLIQRSNLPQLLGAQDRHLKKQQGTIS
jgi:hypothetical protein